MKFALATAAAVATLISGSPTLAAKPKVEPAAASAAARYLLPRTIEALMGKCTPSLAADGFFARDGSALLSRYNKDADSYWPQAREALIQMGKERSGGMDLSTLPDDAVKSMIDSIVPAMLVQKIKPADCPEIERVVELLAPLPPENVAGLVGFAVEMGEKKRSGNASAKGK